MNEISNKSLTSLAVLKANWDVHGTDYMENFVPFFLHLVRAKKYKEINPDTLRKDFEREYGLIIPYHPTIQILNRLKKRNLICINNYVWGLNTQTQEPSNFETVSSEQDRK
ncbi:MAG: hypothetical protein WC878_03310 [Candidatus Paceibacterota bacterium]|jgi:hypothetical protein